MSFWKKKPVDLVPPQNPYVTFEMVDGLHLDIDIGWPVGTDIAPFIRMLVALNNGGIIGPQIVQSTIYATSVNEQDKAIAIHNALEHIMSGNKSDKSKEREKSKDRPFIHPSRVIQNFIKAHK